MSLSTSRTLSAVLLLILVAGTCMAAPASRTPIDAMIDRLKKGQLVDNSPKAEVQQLVAHGVDPQSAIPALKQLLFDENIMMRMLAGSVIWEIGPAGIDAVLATYDDPHPVYRRYVIEVLNYKQYSPAAESKVVSDRIIQIYRRAFKDPDDKVRWMAVNSVGMSPFPPEAWVGDVARLLADAAPVDASEMEWGLISALRDAAEKKPGKQLSPELRKQVLDALLARFKADLNSGQKMRVWQAINNIGRLGDDARPLAPELVRLWSSTNDENIKGSIGSTLSEIAPKEELLPTPTPAPKAAQRTGELPDLIARVRGGNPVDVKDAAEELGKMTKSAASAVPALTAMLHDARNRSRDRINQELAYHWHDAAIEAIDALGEIGSPAAEPAIPELLDALYDERIEFRDSTVTSLARIGRPTSAVLPALVRMLHDNNHEVRRAAADGLGMIGPAAAPALPELLTIYKDNEHGVGRDLIRPLALIDAHAALPLLIEGLNDPKNGNGHRLYAEILGEIGPVAAPAIPALTNAVADMESTWIEEDGEKALLKLAGRKTILEWVKDPDPKRRQAASNILRDLGTADDLKVIAALARDADRSVATTAKSIETDMRRHLFNESGAKTLAELLNDFRIDDVPGNAERAWRTLGYEHAPDKLDQLQRTFAATTDTQQRKAVAMLLANNPMTSPTLELLGLVNDNLRTSSLAEATHDAIEWMIQTQLTKPLAAARTKMLQADERSTDSQLAHLAALALQFDMRYKPTPAELALMVENVEDDGIADNAEMAIEILARRDVHGKRAHLEKLVDSKDPQAAGRAALALLEEPDPAKMTPRLFRALVENLKLDNDVASETVDRTIEVLGRSRIAARRDILEGALRSKVDNRIFHRRVARLLLKIDGYRPSPAMIDHLILQLHADGVKNNAHEAVRELIRLRSPMVIRNLEQALNSDDRQQRLWAADALPTPHEYPGGPPPRLLAVLLENLDDEYHIDSGGWLDDWRSLDNAKGTTQYLIEHPTLATRELEGSLDSKDTQRRWLAAIILGSTGRGRRIGRITEILVPQLRVGGDNWMAGHALEGLGKAVRPYLQRYRNDPDPDLRANVELILTDLKRPPKTKHDLYMREDKYNLRNKSYMRELPEYWSYEDRP